MVSIKSVPKGEHSLNSIEEIIEKDPYTIPLKTFAINFDIKVNLFTGHLVRPTMSMSSFNKRVNNKIHSA